MNFSNTIPDQNFDEELYLKETPEAKFFGQPFCYKNNISEKVRLYLHYLLFAKKEQEQEEKPKEEQSIANRLLSELIDFEKLSGKTIVNCYYDDACSGVGDFLRGCFYLCQLLYDTDVNFEFDFSKHKLGRYIFTNSIKEYETEEIFDTEKHIPLDKRDNGGYVENIKTNILDKIAATESENIFIFTNYCDSLLGFPHWEKNKDPKCSDFMRSNFNFRDNIENKFREILQGDYICVHFRLGDRKLVYNIMDAKNLDPNNINTKDYGTDLDKCLDEIITLFKKTNKKIVVLADSNEFKQYVLDNTPEEFKENIIVVHTNSQHSSNNPGMLRGLNVDMKEKENNMFYVALDLKIMSMSKEIYSYSVYNWGSGFCFWISKIFNIPLIKKKL